MKRRSALLLAVLMLMLPCSASATNQIYVPYTYAFYCGPLDIPIFVENDVDLQSLTLPLVVRSITPGVFWRDSVVLLPTIGRLSTSLTDIQTLGKLDVDFASPDRIMLHFESLTPGSNCLAAGPAQRMITLRTRVMGVGIFEIDTMSFPPCVTPQMLRCSDYVPVPLDNFGKGIIELLPDGLVFIDFASDPVIGHAGEGLQNQTQATDPGGDPLGYFLQSGPGSVNPNTGLWSWETCARDSGSYTVEIEVYQKFCGPETGPVGQFQVNVLPRDSADLNCDGAADAVDLAIAIDHIFFGQSIPPCD